MFRGKSWEEIEKTLAKSPLYSVLTRLQSHKQSTPLPLKGAGNNCKVKSMASSLNGTPILVEKGETRLTA